VPTDALLAALEPDRPPPHRLGLAHGREAMACLAAENLIAALAGEPMPHPVR
jgi:hypothetical protein